MDILGQIKELKAQGYYCSQIIMHMGLEIQGKTNPDLISSMHALAGGVGFNGYLCGALTGGACLLGLYAGTGRLGQPQDERLDLMLGELVYWFKGEFGVKGMDCNQLLDGLQDNIPLRCPSIVASVFQKTKEILVENGFELSGKIND
jgi:hypothetical protein